MVDKDILIFQKARKEDLSDIVSMLQDDILGQGREHKEDILIYETAFEEINKDPNHFLAIIKYNGENIATCHLTIIPTLAISAKKRMNIEAVRVKRKFINQGIGSWMINKAIEFAKEKDVQIIQLTTNKNRSEALKFYQRLGFENTHEGLKFNI